VFFSPLHLGGSKARKNSTEEDNVVLSSHAGSPSVLVIFLAPQAAQIHRGSLGCQGSQPFRCARAERFVIGSSSPEEQCESNGGKKD